MKYEEENIISTPYYETIYLDDNNVKHLMRIDNTDDLAFIKNRFEIVKCDYIKTN